jgi:hypothetical protein
MKTCLMLLGVTCMLASGCQRSNVETPAVIARAPTPVPASDKPANKPGRQPTEAELRDAINRNYEGAVTIDNNQSVPFLIGDFNGDNSEDIAIIVKPAKGKLSELNGKYVNWILEDPRQVSPEQKKQPVTVDGDDLLLAVIHGQDREGWRSKLARQTYLLKNAVGINSQTETVNQLRGNKSLPPLRGDVIRERLDGADGVIYWTGAKYSWHPAG